MLPVLICIDDEMILLKSLEYELEDFFYKRIEIVTAQNPDEAYELIQEILEEQKKIFLIITDHNMGIYDGVEFLKEISLKYPNIQKILLTGYKTQQIENELKTHFNVHAIIEKPWFTSEIIKNVEECLNIFWKNNL